MASNIKNLRSSIIDGIAIVPRYRERQLASLYRALSAAKEDLLGAAVMTLNWTQQEARIEYLQVLHAVSTFHSTCNPVASNEAEYTIAKSKDYPDRRCPCGYSFIIPANESLYSTIAPIAASVSAGNVVLLQRYPKLSALGKQIQVVLVDCLSAGTFAYVDRDPFEEKFQQMRGITFEGTSIPSAVSSTRKIVCPTRRVAAVVDRSADIKLAARDLVQARFSFSGTCAYAPDVVLVNEFKMKEFTEAVAETGLRYLSQLPNGAGHSQGPKSSVMPKNYDEEGSTIISGSRGQVVLLRSKDSGLLPKKVTSPTLLVLPISSMDAAIDMLGQSNTALAALYVFGHPAAAKYITQFVDSAASFVNHVPSDILVGGLAPDGTQLSTQPRYTAEMFSIPAPILINQSARSSAIRQLLHSTGSKEQKILESSLGPAFKSIKEPFGPAIGFFEQGFLFNAALLLSSTTFGAYCCVRYGYPAIVSAF